LILLWTGVGLILFWRSIGKYQKNGFIRNKLVLGLGILIGINIFEKNKFSKF
jgi:hypothetical protein